MLHQSRSRGMELLGIKLIFRPAQNMLGSSLISRAVLAAHVQFDNVGSLDLVSISWTLILLPRHCTNGAETYEMHIELEICNRKLKSDTHIGTDIHRLQQHG